jgi:hypothetical protein
LNADVGLRRDDKDKVDDAVFPVDGKVGAGESNVGLSVTIGENAEADAVAMGDIWLGDKVENVVAAVVMVVMVVGRGGTLCTTRPWGGRTGTAALMRNPLDNAETGLDDDEVEDDDAVVVGLMRYDAGDSGDEKSEDACWVSWLGMAVGDSVASALNDCDLGCVEG